MLMLVSSSIVLEVKTELSCVKISSTSLSSLLSEGSVGVCPIFVGGGSLGWFIAFFALVASGGCEFDVLLSFLIKVCEGIGCRSIIGSLLVKSSFVT